jgi:hypothetical protein
MISKILCCTIVAFLFSVHADASVRRLRMCSKLFESEEYNPFGALPQLDFRDKDIHDQIQAIIKIRKIVPADTLMDTELKPIIEVRDLSTHKIIFEYEQPAAAFVKVLTPYSIIVGTMPGILVLVQFNPESGEITRKLIATPDGIQDKIYPKRIFAKQISDGKFSVLVVLTNLRKISFEADVDSYDRVHSIPAKHLD